MKEDIKAYQYSAIMDERTSDICVELDQKIFKPSELQYYNPPNHFNCRSLIVPIFLDEPFDKYSEIAPTNKVAGGFLEVAK